MNKIKENVPPKFTVIIPTYNRAHVISRAIRSVLNQTFTDFELIIIDDGSKDDTEEVLTTFEDKRLSIIKHIINKGQNAALNTGISNANGAYISFLDSDDEWMPTMLEKQFKKFLENNEYGCVYSRPGYLDNTGNLIPGRKYSLEGSIYKEALVQGYITSPTTLSVKREVIINVGGFNYENKVCQDDMICLKLARHYQFGLVPEILGIIHSDAGNQLIGNINNKAEDTLDLYRTFQSEIIQYCGRKTMAQHLFKAGRLFLDATNPKKARKIVRETLSLDFTIKYLYFYCLSFIPKKSFKYIYPFFRRIPSFMLVINTKIFSLRKNYQNKNVLHNADYSKE